jgi:hypothetical protein
MPLYDTFAHYFDRSIVKHGPMGGCIDYPKHSHVKINPRPIGIAKAKTLADECLVHAQVVYHDTSEVVYANSKPAGVQEGHYPAY